MQEAGRFFGGHPCARPIAARGAHLRFSEYCSGQIVLSADSLQDADPFQHMRERFIGASRVCRQGKSRRLRSYHFSNRGPIWVLVFMRAAHQLQRCQIACNIVS